MTPDQKDYLTGELRRLFIQEKKGKLGRRYVLHPRFQKQELWEDAAELCAAYGATPNEFIQAAFDGCRIKDGPQPTHLKSKKAMSRWWMDYSAGAPAAGSSSDTHITQLSDTILGDMDWRLKAATTEALALLRSSSESYPAWFRVVMRPDDHQIWNDYGWIAIKQILQQPRLLNELRERGFNVDQILNHDDLPKPPVWVEQLKEQGVDTENYEY